MKALVTALFVGTLGFSTTACAKEEVKQETVQVAQADSKKDAAKTAQPETKKVCIDVQGKDGKPVMGKDGKPKQNCTTVKVRQKFEGTKIEDAKKK
jgi:crotonobetainyl-CoA:carnitine CoA-transferase CaiB-like acyl-CoA transferase